MAHIGLESGRPADREWLSSKAVEVALAVTLAVLQAAWTSVLFYGVWRLIL